MNVQTAATTAVNMSGNQGDAADVLIEGGRMESPIDRYDNKVGEMNTIALVAALTFGFSVSLWIEFPESVFVDHEVLAYIFTLASLATIVCSAMATVIAISAIVSLRRLMFKFGRETDTEALRKFKRDTHHLRHFVRYFVYLSYLGLFVSLSVYSHAKWSSINIGNGIIIMSYGVLVAGLVMLMVVYRQVKSAYVDAMEDVEKRNRKE